MKDGGPAFPVPDLHPGAMQVGSSGMSLRDWFAGQETLADIRDDLSSDYFDALAGCPMPLPPRGKILSAFDYIEIAQWDARWRATLKYIRADAMLRAREGGAR